METRNPGGGECRRVVVGVDDPPGGLAALQRAVDLARDRSAPLVAVRSRALGLPWHGGHRHRRMGTGHVHMVPFFNGAEQRHESAHLVRTAFMEAMGDVPHDVEVTIATPQGDPGRVLTQVAADGDVLVVGSGHDQHLKRLVHGSVSRHCREHAQCPVVVVAPPGAVEPRSGW
jgi:nucleotide-binding universal stress UspA family protein